MNMHHITKSLFVGAAIVGTGMLSGKAEIKIPQSLRAHIRRIVERRLEDCYRQVQTVVPKAFSRDLWEQKQDMGTLSDLILNQHCGFFRFCSPEMMKGALSRSELEKDLRYFFENQCPPYEQTVRFLNQRIRRSPLILHRIIRSIIGEGDPYGDEFRNSRYSEILAQRGIVEKYEYSFGFKHSFVFSNEFIRSIADAIFEGMTVVNEMSKIAQDADRGNKLLRVYLKSVQQLYMRYLLLKDSPRGKDTIAECYKFIEKAEQLGRYNHCMASYSPDEKGVADYVSEKNSTEEGKRLNRAFFNAVAEIGEWKQEIETVRDDEEMRPFSDPYWFKPEISEQQKADALKELEDSDDESPNAFLEEID